MSNYSLMQIFDPPISYPRCFASIAGVTGAIMISHALYCTRRESFSDKWLDKTPLTWEFETGLTRFEQESAKKRLKNIGILEEKNINCFRINTEILHNILLSLDPSDFDIWEEI